MKRTLIILTAALLFVSMPQKSQAQEPQQPEQSEFQGRRQREQPDPEKLAEKAADQLDGIVGLSKKQYKKVYKFQFKMIYDAIEDGTWRDERSMGRQWNGGPRGPRPDGQRPDMAQRPDGQRPDMAQRPDGQRPQRPQMTEEEREARMAQRKAMMEERQAKNEQIREAEKERKALTEEKYKKILTPEQYDKWQQYLADEAAKREQRMKEMMERRGQQRRPDGPQRPPKTTDVND